MTTDPTAAVVKGTGTALLLLQGSGAEKSGRKQMTMVPPFTAEKWKSLDSWSCFLLPA
jgi:hypothetical protein